MAWGPIILVFIVVLAVYLIINVILPPLIIMAFNLALIYVAGKQALERWQTKTHYWYEMGIIFSFLITMFYGHLFPIWPIAGFMVLAVVIAEAIQWIEAHS